MATPYRVNVLPWGVGWELHVQDVGTTQARSVREFETMARDLVGPSP